MTRLLMLFLSTWLVACLAIGADAATVAAQKTALVNFYNAMNGANWVNPWTLLGDPCTSWYSLLFRGDAISTHVFCLGMASHAIPITM